MRALISNIDSSLNNSAEIDVFINNAKYSVFLNRVTRYEQKITARAYKYTDAQLVETLP